MKGVKPILVALLLQVYSISAQQGQCEHDRLYAVQGDCTRFRRCDEGFLRHPESCGAGTAFSEQNQICLHFNEVNNPDCAQVTIDQGRFGEFSQLCQNPPPGVDPSQAWNVPHPQYCNGFIVCGNGRAIPSCQLCPQNTIFPDNEFRVCRPGKQKNCGPGRTIVPFQDYVTVRALEENCRAPGPVVPIGGGFTGFGGNTGGNTGFGGNTGGNTGYGGNRGGNTGGNTGYGGNRGGSTGGSTGYGGNRGGSTGGSTGYGGNRGGSTGGNTGYGGNRGGSTGGNTGYGGNRGGNTGGSGGRTGGSSWQTGSTGGQTGGSSWQTGGRPGGGSSWQTGGGTGGGSSWQTGGTGGRTGGSSWQTGGTGGRTGGSSWQTGGTGGRTGGGSSWQTGGSTGGRTGGGSSWQTGGSTGGQTGGGTGGRTGGGSSWQTGGTGGRTGGSSWQTGGSTGGQTGGGSSWQTGGTGRQTGGQTGGGFNTGGNYGGGGQTGGGGVHQFQGLCQIPPPGYNYSVPWHVAHPNYCNGFIRCANGSALLPCEICATGTYFPENTYGVCLETPKKSNFQGLCGNRRMINPLEVDQIRSQAPDCNPAGAQVVQRGGRPNKALGGGRGGGGGGGSTGGRGGGGSTGGGGGGGGWQQEQWGREW